MYKYSVAAWLAIFLFIFSSCKDDSADSVPRVKQRTVLVYMIAQNSLADFSVADHKELLEGMKAVDDSLGTLLLYIDDYSTPRLLKITRNFNGTVSEDIIKTYPSQVSTSPEVMSQVLSDAFSLFPAKGYGLTLWSHADGWVPKRAPARYFGIDGTEGMDITELRSVLEKSPHLDFLFFDACFMQTVEVDYELKGCADYIVGSAMEIPAPGAPYNTVAPAFFSKTNPALEIARQYYQTYANFYDSSITTGDNVTYNKANQWIAGVSVSVVDCSKLNLLASRTAPIIATYADTLDTSNIFCYDKRSTRYYFDFVEFMKRIAPSDSLFTSWYEAYQQVVPYYQTTATNLSAYVGNFSMDGSYGLSTYILTRKFPALVGFYHTYSWYQVSGWKACGF